MNILKLITPLNLGEEKERFFADGSYDPVFNYAWEREPIVNDSPDILKGELFQAVLAQRHEDITAKAQQYFGVDLQSDHAAAEADLQRKYYILPKVELEELVEAYKEAFVYFGLDHVVEVNDHPGYGIRPQHKQKKLLISRTYSYQYMDIKGSVKHEMSHVIRYENGKYNGIERAADYLPSEEGLATFVQDYTPIIKPSLFQHAAEYEASRLGVQGSLRQMFDHFLALGFDKDLAWQRAARHKFGFKDTKQPGDIIKPAMYYFNARKLLDLSQEDILKLFRGKISLSQALEGEGYAGRFEKEKIVAFFELEDL